MLRMLMERKRGRARGGGGGNCRKLLLVVRTRCIVEAEGEEEGDKFHTFLRATASTHIAWNHQHVSTNLT